MDDLEPSEVDPHATSDHISSEDDIHSSSLQSHSSRTVSSSSNFDAGTCHTIALSSIEHCMPKAYIRICFAYRTQDSQQCDEAISKLRTFVRQIVGAKPYLAGYAVETSESNQAFGRCEVRFSTKDFLEYPELQVRHLYDTNGKPLRYDDLDREGFPPSCLRPEEVAVLPPDVDDKPKASLFQAQANIVDGGLIVSVYLHHCISDGRGFELLALGRVLRDDFTFHRLPEPGVLPMAGLDGRLKLFAQRESVLRARLSECSPNLANTRMLKARNVYDKERPRNKPGRGCIVVIARDQVVSALEACHAHNPDTTLTKQNLLMALLWRHMTRARQPTVSHNPQIRTSKLLIPVDIREKLADPLPESYFGAAVDFAKAELDLEVLVNSELSIVASEVRRAVHEVDESYIRQAVALANLAGPDIDVADLQAANMDRVKGADMYITSWLKMKAYQADFDMGLGGPDYVRKPWSRDPGSCIILPQKCHNPEYYEVVVQMTEADMGRLLMDKEFMEFVIRIIE